MSVTLFDLYNDLKHKNYRDDEYLEACNYKGMHYMLNRFMSMDPDNLQVCNIANMLEIPTDRMHFDFFYHLTPKTKRFIKYIKSDKDKESNEELINSVAENMKLSHREVSDYISLLSKEQIKELKSEFGGKAR